MYSIRKPKKQGVEEGKKEGKREEKMDIAKVSIKKGLPIDLIVDITGLTAEEIEKLVGSDEE